MEAAAFQAANPPAPVFLVRVPSLWQEAKFSGNLLLLALVIGAALEVSGPTWVRTVLEAVTLESLSGVTALAAALVVAVLAHEAGHLAAASLMNFELLGFSIGPFRFDLAGPRSAVRSSGRFFRASISAVPRHLFFWRKRTLLLVAAGPAATFLTGIGALALLSYAPVSGWPKMFLASLAELSFFLFLLGLAPNRADAQTRNDARLFLGIARGAPEARDVQLYHRVMALQLEGVAPGDYSEILIRELAAFRGRLDSMLFFAGIIARWAAARNDTVTAAAWQQRVRSLLTARTSRAI